MQSICLCCGNCKEVPYEKCIACGFQPSDEDGSLVKSVYLSLGRYDTPCEQSRYEPILNALAEKIAQGEEIAFDCDDLRRLDEQKETVKDINDAVVMQYLFRVFFPGLLFVLLMIGILMALKLM
jgi:hypothetical protein